METKLQILAQKLYGEWADAWLVNEGDDLPFWNELDEEAKKTWLEQAEWHLRRNPAGEI